MNYGKGKAKKEYKSRCTACQKQIISNSKTTKYCFECKRQRKRMRGNFKTEKPQDFASKLILAESAKTYRCDMYGEMGLCNKKISKGEKYYFIQGATIRKVCYNCGRQKGRFSFFTVDKLTTQNTKNMV